VSEHSDGPASSDPAAIEAEIEATRARLAGTVDELSGRLQPKEIGRRSLAGAQTRVRAATTTPDGAPRVERLAAIGAALAVLVALMAWSRRRRSR
jgi:hypothetical protein